MKINFKTQIIILFLIVKMVNMGLELSIMTYNIYGLRKYNGNELANVIKKYNPDFISLQEVDKNTKRSNNRDVTEDIANSLGYNYYYFQKTLDYDGGEFGISVISKYPIKEIFTYNLPSQGEQRHLIGVKLDEEIIGREITIINTHFDYRDSKIEEQLESALRIIKEYSEGVVFFSGDFNFLPNSKFYNTMKENWIDTYENYIDIENDLRIDYIFGDKSNEWEVVKSYFVNEKDVDWVGYSDHFPYMSRVKLSTFSRGKK